MGRRGGGDVSAQVIMVEEGVLQMAADQRPGGSLDQESRTQRGERSFHRNCLPREGGHWTARGPGRPGQHKGPPTEVGGTWSCTHHSAHLPA
jgi:hypothetical protein